MIALASVRGDVANYVSALFTVYILVILLYIITTLAFSFGLRPPYSRWTDALLGFLRDMSEPYLRLFRRFVPRIGMFDFSPIIAIIVLYIADDLITSLIR